MKIEHSKLMINGLSFFIPAVFRIAIIFINPKIWLKFFGFKLFKQLYQSRRNDFQIFREEKR